MTDLPEGLVTGLADRYTIERELGAGAMASVYLARDARHDRHVALWDGICASRWRQSLTHPALGRPGGLGARAPGWGPPPTLAGCPFALPLVSLHTTPAWQLDPRGPKRCAPPGGAGGSTGTRAREDQSGVRSA